MQLKVDNPLHQLDPEVYKQLYHRLFMDVRTQAALDSVDDETIRRKFLEGQLQLPGNDQPGPLTTQLFSLLVR